MTRDLVALSGIDDLRAIDSKDREVLVEVVADEEVSPIRCEADRLRKGSDLKLLHPSHGFALDP